MAIKSKSIKQLGRIGVLMGGPSSEREISLKSGKAVYESLRQLNLDVVSVDIKTDNIKENIRLIKSYKIECAFLSLHGKFGEDGRIQEILEALNVPYTCSGVLSSRLAMDKIVSRHIFEVYGLSVPKSKIVDRLSYNANLRLYNSLSFPLVIKPATGGSSIGVSFVDKEEDLHRAVDWAFTFDEKVIIEEYVEGREITVGILGKRALPVVEIIPKTRFFDYEAKYKVGITDYVVPAKLEEKVAYQIKRIAMLAHKLLGCFGCSRVDMILGKDNTVVILEVNTIPGLTATSLLPKAAKSEGIEFQQLCLRLIELAYEKAKTQFSG